MEYVLTGLHSKARDVLRHRNLPYGPRHVQCLAPLSNWSAKRYGPAPVQTQCREKLLTRSKGYKIKQEKETLKRHCSNAASVSLAHETPMSAEVPHVP